MGQGLKVLIDGLVFENTHQIGIWRYFYEVLRRLAGRVDIVLWLRNESLQPIPDKVRVLRDCGRKDYPKWNLPGRVRRKISNAFPAIRNESGSVFHSTYFTNCPFSHTASVVTVHDMVAEMAYCYSGGGWAPHIQAKRETILAAKRIIAISSATKDDLIRFYPEVEDKIRVIHHGSEHLKDLSNSTTLGISTSPFALFIGHRDGYKNFHTLTEAMRCSAWPSHLAVRVVGSPFADHEQRLIDAYGLRDKIRNLGRLSDADLRTEYRSATCFIFPSLLEGFGLPLLEAQINCCPVVASNIAVFHEVVGDSALFFDARIGEKLAETVGAACEPEIRKRLIEAGVENVKRFSWDRTAEQVLAVYDEALRSS